MGAEEKVIRDGDEIGLININGKDEYDLSIIFQGEKYMLKSAIELLEESNEEEVEIFPGIYIRKEKGNLIQSLCNKISKANTYIIRNENHKDSIEICKLKMEEDAPKYNVISKGEEYVNPQDVKWPINLGGGKCGGCMIYDYFTRLGLENGDNYEFFDMRSQVSSTAGIQYFDDLCKRHKCYEYYQSIANEGYNVRKDWSGKEDHITIDCTNGIMSVGEGKHRICALKRFGYDKEIPMIVTRCTRTMGEKYMSPLFTTPYASKDKMKRIIAEFDDKCQKLGISRESARESLKLGESPAEFLGRSKYTYAELYDRS